MIVMLTTGNRPHLLSTEEHPIAKAGGIHRIESDPAAWVHDAGDRDRCQHCSELIHLSDGEYLAVTLAHGEYLDRTKRLFRLCSADCYREWASEGLDVGW